MRAIEAMVCQSVVTWCVDLNLACERVFCHSKDICTACRLANAAERVCSNWTGRWTVASTLYIWVACSPCVCVDEFSNRIFDCRFCRRTDKRAFFSVCPFRPTCLARPFACRLEALFSSRCRPSPYSRHDRWLRLTYTACRPSSIHWAFGLPPRRLFVVRGDDDGFLLFYSFQNRPQHFWCS